MTTLRQKQRDGFWRVIHDTGMRLSRHRKLHMGQNIPDSISYDNFIQERIGDLGELVFTGGTSKLQGYNN